MLKIKAKIGELLPAKSPKETGRGKKTRLSDRQVFDRHTITAYRKLAANIAKLDEYAEAVEDVARGSGVNPAGECYASLAGGDVFPFETDPAAGSSACDCSTMPSLNGDAFDNGTR